MIICKSACFFLCLLQLYGDLTKKQANSIMDYMKTQSGLNIASAYDADLNSNYIYSIDPVLPGKEEVLNYIDNDGPEVQTKAKVGNLIGHIMSRQMKIMKMRVYNATVMLTVMHIHYRITGVHL